MKGTNPRVVIMDEASQMSDSTVKTAMCYRADGSLKWATMLPNGAELPETTIYEGEKLWDHVIFGTEKDGRTFFVPMHGPIEGPIVVGRKEKPSCPMHGCKEVDH